MKVYAQFYNNSVKWNGNESRVIEACGDRAVLILDANDCTYDHHRIAEDWAIKHGFIAYKIVWSSTFKSEAYPTQYMYVDDVAVKNVMCI